MLEKRLLIKIDDWDIDETYPRGHFISVLGDLDDRETDIKVLMYSNDVLIEPFTEEMLNELPEHRYTQLPKN